MEKKTKRKILTSAGIIIMAGLGYTYVKNMRMEISGLKRVVAEQSHNIDTLMTACGEGLFEESIATVTRKVNNVTDRIAVMTEVLKTRPNDIQTIKQLEAYKLKLDLMMTKRADFIKAKEVYELICDD